MKPLNDLQTVGEFYSYILGREIDLRICESAGYPIDTSEWDRLNKVKRILQEYIISSCPDDEDPKV